MPDQTHGRLGTKTAICFSLRLCLALLLACTPHPGTYCADPATQAMLPQAGQQAAFVAASQTFIATHSQSDKAGISGSLAGGQNRGLEADENESVYADEAALPSFAQMAAAQGLRSAAAPQLWSDRPIRIAPLQQRYSDNLPGGRKNGLSPDLMCNGDR